MKTKLLTALFGAMLTCYAVSSTAQNTWSNNGAGNTIKFLGGTGVNNSGFGTQALFLTNAGSYNTATGYWSLYNNVNGNNNTANGYQSLYLNTASNNTANGYQSMYNNTNGSYNTALGHSSLFTNITGNYNTAGGYKSLFSNTGSNNTAFGFSSLYSNQNGEYNTAVGNSSMYYNTTASNNTAIGRRSMYKNTTGQENSAFGSGALYSNQTGFYNTAGGYNSLYNNTGAAQEQGSKNTAYGYYSLFNNTIGECNTAVGHNALLANTTGINNTAIGCGADVSVGGLFNSTMVGHNAVAWLNNQMVLGDAALASIWAGGVMIWPSDSRFKRNIKENVPGLDFIKQLRPVTYNYNIHSLSAQMRGNKDLIKNSSEDEKIISDKEQKVFTGFIAQEVEAAANKLGYDFSGVHHPENDKDLYGLGYVEFVVPLVKAVQELAKQNENLQEQINELKTAKIFGSENNAASTSSTKLTITNASLGQSIPNPLTNTTSIRYNIPAAFKTAQIVITDFSGKAVKHITLKTTGTGVLNVDASLLSSGVYSYSLIVDGKIIDSKKMIVAK